MEKIKFLEHTADIKFQAFGKTKEELFKNCAQALKQSISEDLEIKEKIEKKIKVKGEDLENLLYVFLEEILYLLDAEGFLFSRIKTLTLKNNHIEAILLGDNSSNYEFTNNVKAVTYNDMIVKKEENIWTAQVVLDV